MNKKTKPTISNGVMLNSYPDSIGKKLSDAVNLLQRPELEDVFSLFYILPTFFNSDLDRGFSIIDYNLNETLVHKMDLEALENLEMSLKFDIVLNHLSVASPQFKDLLEMGQKSKYKDFFINWNSFWQGQGELGEDGIIIPYKEHLSKLFMRKAGLPILKVQFPDGSEQPYWNTFYQDVTYNEIYAEDLKGIEGVSPAEALIVCEKVNSLVSTGEDFNTVNLGQSDIYKKEILQIIEKKKTYLGQMDVNAKSELVWEFFEATLSQLKNYGCKIVRLDAFAYLHKEVGQTNFFNKPGTWDYLERIREIAAKNELMLLPEIHAEYGTGIHNQVANKGYYIYDFFLPGLVIHTIENGTSKALLNWAHEIIDKDYKTVNMLGCHDGIPVLDLKGKEINGSYQKGLLEDNEIETIMKTIMDRGGMVKNLYDPNGKKISYYQINTTFFSALGEDEQKLLLARAIQLFMPGIPQVWYLDLFAGKNNYNSASRAKSGGHKEINRTNLRLTEIEEGLKSDIVLNQLELLRLRNTSKAFSGKVAFDKTDDSQLNIRWSKEDEFAHLKADLKTLNFSINFTESGTSKNLVY